jgi:glycerol-3-phosphate acyltransferase PlsY
MEYGIAVLVFVLSYFIGSISFGRVITRILDPEAKLDDIEMPIAGVDEEGYKLTSIGGNTVSMKFGGRVGCLVGILDILKAFIPTLVVRVLYPDQPYLFIAAIAALIGHNWPIYYRFKGGRGISPFYGGLFAIDPIGAVVVATASMIIGMLLLKEPLFAYAGGALLLIPWSLLTKMNQPVYVFYVLIVNFLFILAMIPEVRQIIRLRKKYGKREMTASLNQFPMGKSMLKMMNMIKVKKSSDIESEN